MFFLFMFRKSLLGKADLFVLGLSNGGGEIQMFFLIT